MTPYAVLAAVLAALCASPALAAPSPATDGKALFAAKGCQACHGEAGAKPIAGSPVIAGQNAIYLARQMTEIADGTRTSAPVKVMKPIIEKTTPDERKALAEWLSTQKPADPQTGDKAKAEQGAELFDENGCIGCHGADGLKPLADYPFLAAQRKDYLMIQIKAIRDEIRSTRRTRMMTANVRKFSDAQVEQVAEFLSQTKRK
ncbi:c-type cytochrome [Paramagnetospirillum magneticum]|uniref:Cytochrome C4 n=1 Tax=Paramagnetospirillum magneticum (strain ATCC 700264 / AMB-1) TaxID=342108 RepID=Q2VYU7_PARM1|nr:c-type cytochrome [Paramagnetospirillum magneticum]BAE53228.1 Cytochrome C4 precursor [Paramagnetospirillum magneticum AMB-1]